MWAAARGGRGPHHRGNGTRGKSEKSSRPRAGPAATLVAIAPEPISPELALVDPELAERARSLLPDPPDALRPRPRPVVAAAATVEPAAAPPPPAPAFEQPRRRWGLALAVGFVLGAFFGGLIGAGSGAPEPDFAAAPLATTHSPSAAQPPKTVAARSPGARRRHSRTGVAGARHALRPRARNVFGVRASVAGRTVKLAWLAPGSSRHVVVFRARGAGGRGAIVYRGRGTRFRDTTTRRCTAYRYTIVNHDRSGRASTGVRTRVVTGSCG